MFDGGECSDWYRWQPTDFYINILIGSALLDAAFGLFSHRKKLFQWSSQNALLQFLLEVSNGIVLFINQLLDSIISFSINYDKEVVSATQNRNLNLSTNLKSINPPPPN